MVVKTLAVLLSLQGLVYCLIEDLLNINQSVLIKSSYSESNAITYTYASSLVYCEYDKILDFSCGYVCDYLRHHKLLKLFKSRKDYNSIKFAFLHHEYNKELIISFEGTDNVQQLLDQIANSNGVPYTIHQIGNAEVLNYFYNAYVSDLRPTFLTYLRDTLNSKGSYIQKITFTGHSLGGAMALHALADAVHSHIIKDTYYDVSAYTFGQPRIGDDKLKNSNIYRVVNYDDIVSHMPPCNPFGSTKPVGACKKSGNSWFYYPYHLPTEVWYSRNMASYEMCSSTIGEDSKCSDSHALFSIDPHLYYFGIRVGNCGLNT